MEEGRMKETNKSRLEKDQRVRKGSRETEKRERSKQKEVVSLFLACMRRGLHDRAGTYSLARAPRINISKSVTTPSFPLSIFRLMSRFLSCSNAVYYQGIGARS